MAKIKLTAIHTIFAGKPGEFPIKPGDDFTVDNQEEADRLKAIGAARDSDAVVKGRAKADAEVRAKVEADAKAKADAEAEAKAKADADAEEKARLDEEELQRQQSGGGAVPDLLSGNDTQQQ